MNRSTPANVAVVATLFLVSGISTALGFVTQALVLGTIMLPLGAIGIFVGYGLLNLEEAWRRVAVWILALVAVLSLLGLFFGSLASMIGSPRIIGNVGDVEPWRIWVSGGLGVVAYGAGVLYSLATLTDSDTKKLFKEKKNEEA